MFKENDLSGLSWLPLISSIVCAKHPRDPRDLATLHASSLREREDANLAFTTTAI